MLFRSPKQLSRKYKYRRGGRTLCGLYLRESCLGFMVILGKAEREKFEQDRANFSDSIVQAYDAATTYHDGKWLMIELQDERLFTDLKKLLKTAVYIYLSPANHSISIISHCSPKNSTRT